MDADRAAAPRARAGRGRGTLRTERGGLAGLPRMARSLRGDGAGLPGRVSRHRRPADRRRPEGRRLARGMSRATDPYPRCRLGPMLGAVSFPEAPMATRFDPLCRPEPAPKARRVLEGDSPLLG